MSLCIADRSCRTGASHFQTPTLADFLIPHTFRWHLPCPHHQRAAASELMARKLSPAYQQRRPTETVLYRVLDEHLADFIARVERADRPMPAFVRAELEGFLRWGVLEFGLAVQQCESCSFERVVGLSCGGRGFCPACLARRMAQTSAHLVDSILPHVPYRQLVLSLPPPLRFMLAYDAEVCSHVLQLFLRGVFRWQRHTAKRELGLRNVRDVHGGALTAIQRSGGSANLNLHFHTILADGVYLVERQSATPRFHALPPPTQPELDNIAWHLYRQVLQLITKLGLDWQLPADDSDFLAAIDPLLLDCATAAIHGTTLFGEQAGQRLRQIGTVACHDHASSRRHRPSHAFDLHATRRVSMHDRRALERLCRYILRPPIAHDRLERLHDGRIRLRFVRPWSNGTSHQVMTPLDLISRLVSWVPPPRIHQIRYHGFLARRAEIRPLVIPDRTEQKGKVVQLHLLDARQESGTSPASATANDGDASPARTPKLQRISWARLLERVHDYDMETCPHCGGVMRVVRCVLAAEPIQALLEARGHDEQGSPRSRPPARAPPQLAFAFTSNESPADANTIA